MISKQSTGSEHKSAVIDMRDSGRLQDMAQRQRTGNILMIVGFVLASTGMLIDMVLNGSNPIKVITVCIMGTAIALAGVNLNRGVNIQREEERQDNDNEKN